MDTTALLSAGTRPAAALLEQDVTFEAFQNFDLGTQEEILGLCGNIRGMKVLDVGSGEGSITRWLKRHGASQVQGLGLSETQITRAIREEKINPLGIGYMTGSAESLFNFPESRYDLIVALFLFNTLSIEQMQRCLTQMHRILKEGGTLLCNVRCIHKFFEDYFRALKLAGFSQMPEVQEIHIEKQEPEFFESLHDLPLHLVVKVVRETSSQKL